MLGELVATPPAVSTLLSREPHPIAVVLHCEELACVDCALHCSTMSTASAGLMDLLAPVLKNSGSWVVLLGFKSISS